MPEGTTNVAIVGAGPAGAALAHVFASRGIDTTLIERQSDFEREFRGEVLMPSGIRAFDEMGLGRDLDELPSRRLSAMEIHSGNDRLLELDFEGLAAPIGPRVVSQPAMLEMLIARCEAFECFRFERGVSVRDIIVEDSRVVGVELQNREGRRPLRVGYVIGADGRASVIRKKLALESTRKPQGFDVVWCKLPSPDGAEWTDRGRFFIGGGHFAIAIPSHDGRLQVGWMIEKGGYGDLRRQGIEDWVLQLSEHVGSALGEHIRKHLDAVTTPFVLDVICDRVSPWSVPGALLIGDAAHPMSPVGGQGINIALRDALVCANHLAPLLRGGAEPHELDRAGARVEAERLPEVSRVQLAQQLPPQFLFRNPRLTDRLIRALPALERIGVLRPLFRFGFKRMAEGVTRVRLE